MNRRNFIRSTAAFLGPLFFMLSMSIAPATAQTTQPLSDANRTEIRRILQSVGAVSASIEYPGANIFKLLASDPLVPQPPAVDATPWPEPYAGKWASRAPPKTTRTVRVTNSGELGAALGGNSVKIQVAPGLYTVGNLIIGNDVYLIGEDGAKIYGVDDTIFSFNGSRAWVENLKVDGNRNHAFDVTKYGRDATVTKCSPTQRIGYFFNVGAGAIGARCWKNAAPDGVTDNFFYTGAYSSFVECESNYNPKGSINEHCFRLHSDDGRVVGNDFAMNLRTDGVIKGFQVRIGHRVYVGYNKLGGNGGQVSVGPLFDAGNAGKWLDELTIEENDLSLRQFQVTEGLRGLIVRRNRIDRGTGTVFNSQASNYRNDPPAGYIEQNVTKGSSNALIPIARRFISGDTSKLSYRSRGNTLNGALVN